MDDRAASKDLILSSLCLFLDIDIFYGPDHINTSKPSGMSRRSDRPHRHSRSSRTQQEDIPIDPNLTTEAQYPEYSETQFYASAGPNQIQ
ncbi:hypothetical protein NW766_004661 [Fusarium irregulare]|uniref:Uncharacterized protein n=1 Tax=Fusarium irregulare TaxID=2494466 RepID=A0A9W8UC70_9HYPO|nr:hypothetical protein NW766_004661 [Fusarium irregulare]